MTPKQHRRFFELQHSAWLAHCDRSDSSDPTDRSAETAWRHQETLLACGVEHTSDIDEIGAFEKVMLHWAEITGDDCQIAYWSSAAERRMKRRIRIACDQLARIEHVTVGWEYVRGIASHMHIPEDINDCPAALLWKVYQAIDTHVRRRRADHAVARATSSSFQAAGSSPASRLPGA